MTTRDRSVIIVVLVVAAIVGSWLMFVEPKRSQASHLGDQIKTEQTQLADAQARLAAGEAAKRTYSHYYTDLARLGEAVPSDDNVPSMIYQLQNAAKASGIDFRSLVLNGGSNTPAAATGVVTGASLPPGVTVGPAGLPIEPFTFTFRGSFFRLASFLGRVQRFVTTHNNEVLVSGRLMSLNAITLGAAPAGFPQIQATVSATTYLVPSSEGLFGGATPAGPAPSTSQSVSTATPTAPTSSAVVTPPVQ